MTPLAHLLRPAPPWRTATPLTECGRPGNDVAALTTVDEIRALIRKVGQLRAAMSTCMTCAQSADRNPAWDVSPSAVLAREVPAHVRWHAGARAQVHGLDTELRAIAALIEAHREEYDATLDGLGQTADLNAHRRARARQ